MTPTTSEAADSMVDAVRQFLTKEGWQQYKLLGREIWCKRWKDAPRCRSKGEKEGIHAVVHFHESDGRTSYEIEVTGQKPDGVWVKLSAYTIPSEEIIIVLNSQANQLVAAWTMMANAWTPI